MELLERVGTGELKLEYATRAKEHFNPYGPIRDMKQDDDLFNREKYIFANTVKTTVE